MALATVIGELQKENIKDIFQIAVYQIIKRFQRYTILVGNMKNFRQWQSINMFPELFHNKSKYYRNNLSVSLRKISKELAVLITRTLANINEGKFVSISC